MDLDLCKHKAVAFPTTDEGEAAVLQHFTVAEVRELWPRFDGACECGYRGIAYASYAHYIAGDW